MSILEQIGFKKQKNVGICISANNFIELMCIDENTKVITNYASDNVGYNSSVKEIANYNELRDVIERLFVIAGLDPKECSVTLCIPNVHFGMTMVQNVSEEPFIIENIQSDIEDLYIFKRTGSGPAISYQILENGVSKDNRSVIYSAIQAKAFAEIMRIFDEVGAKLVRIETSFSALFSAIQYCDKKFNNLFEPGKRTLVQLITQNSCSTFFFVGSIINDVNETPLAVKSFTSEEVYSAISKITEDAISKNSPELLFVISETDDVDSKVLVDRINFTGEVNYLLKNTNENSQFMEVDSLNTDIDSGMLSYMSLEAIGTAVASYDTKLIDINFIPKDKIAKDLIKVGGYTIGFVRYLFVVIIMSIVVGTLIALTINGILSLDLQNKSRTNEETIQQINVFQKNVEQGSDNFVANILPIITEIINRNDDIINTFDALSENIPQSVYVDKFLAKSNGDIGILGEARTSEAVEAFVSNLRAKNDELSLTKLSINTQSSNANAKIPKGYTFEIKTNQSINFDDFDFINQKPQNKDGYTNDGSGQNNGYPPPPMI